MAKSYVCKDCNTLLQSVSELQKHSDATGHASFEESTQVIRRWACSACGKVCRSDAEMDLHKKFTSHTEFVEKTNEEEVLDTAQQMAAARAALEEEEGGSGGGASKDADAGKKDGQPVEMVAAVVDADKLAELVSMGFGEHRATRALHFSGGGSTDAAVNWLVDHEDDADLDTPLLLPKEDPGPKLTPEEARRKAEELVRKARERREAEEREAERLRELERIRQGKEMAAARRAEEEQALRRNYEARLREKEEARRAREQIKMKLEEDKRERRRKLGLPEEPTPEELEREAQRAAAAKKEEAAKKLPEFIKPISAIEKMRGQLVSVKKAHPGEEEKFKTACGTLIKYLGNIARAPDEDKFRSIKLSNAAFQSRVAAVSGTVDFLVLCGFQKGEDVLTMPRDAVSMELLNAAGAALNDAITNPFFGVL